MNTPHIRRRSASASELFVSQAVATRLLALQGSYDCDIDGALEAGQYGMAFVAARNALHQAVFVHLAREGKAGGLPTDVSNQVFELLAAHDREGDVWKEAWRLECSNPITPDEVRSYTEQYRRFFTDVLALDKLSAYGTLLSDLEYSRYLDSQEELSNVFEHLGIKGINLPESHRRAERRTLVKSHLREKGTPRASHPEGANPPAAAAVDVGPGVDAALAVHVSLTDDDARAFGSLLREQISELSLEVARTDGRDERRRLLARQALCERLLVQVEAAAASLTQA